MHTFPEAFLKRLMASVIRSLTSRSPFPHGTKIRVAPKQTETFILFLPIKLRHACVDPAKKSNLQKKNINN